MRTLKEIREQEALTVLTLARKAGVSPSTIARVESGLPARHVTRRKIAKALKVSPKDIDFNLTYNLI
jgi:transcriptional regulator with XRE-family HTH domain